MKTKNETITKRTRDDLAIADKKRTLAKNAEKRAERAKKTPVLGAVLHVEKGSKFVWRELSREGQKELFARYAAAVEIGEVEFYIVGPDDEWKDRIERSVPFEWEIVELNGVAFLTLRPTYSGPAYPHKGGFLPIDPSGKSKEEIARRLEEINRELTPVILPLDTIIEVI